MSSYKSEYIKKKKSLRMYALEPFGDLVDYHSKGSLTLFLNQLSTLNVKIASEWISPCLQIIVGREIFSVKLEHPSMYKDLNSIDWYQEGNDGKIIWSEFYWKKKIFLIDWYSSEFVKLKKIFKI
jgi:hypothetical protein